MHVPCRSCPCLALFPWHVRTCCCRAPGAQRRLCWCKGVSTLHHVLLLSGVSTVHCCTVCGVYLFRSTPFMRMLSTFSCPLASSCLTWAALSQPQSCFGCSTRDDVSSLWLRGLRRAAFSFLGCSVLSWRPIYPGQLEPTTLPLRRLAPVSCSVGLSPTLSLPISLALPCSISLLLLSVPFPLCSTLSLSLSLSLSLAPPPQKKGVRVVRCISIPPGVRTILHGTEEVWCIH